MTGEHLDGVSSVGGGDLVFVFCEEGCQFVGGSVGYYYVVLSE